MAAVYVVAALSALYGLGWFVFAFVTPPALLSRAFTPVPPLNSLPDPAGRILLGIFWGIVVPVGASTAIAWIL